jgi:hypothetical protein
MDAVKNLLDKYGQEDPAEGNGLGEFTDPDLQDLYNNLIDQGILSKLDALEVGVIIEETDIEDLQDIINATDKPDIEKICENLLNGSSNHLEAFEREIELMADTSEL